MRGPYHISSGTQYPSFLAAASSLGILGLNRSNCVEYGCVVPTDDDRPSPSATHKSTLSAHPTENEDGSWSYKWSTNSKTPEELADDLAAKVQAIKAERDRRLPLDFEFNGKMYQRDAVSIARISGGGALALGAMVQGAQPGNLRWHGRDTDFAWIASDDTLTTMDAQTCFSFGAAAAAVETEIIFAAKALRNMDPIPDDFTDDKWWP